MRLAKCINIADLRARARTRLPRPVFGYLDGGADDERSLARNTDAFGDWELWPYHLNDISKIDLSIKILGTEIALPFILSPTAMSRLFHHGAEYAVARAAGEAGTFCSLSTLGTAKLEDLMEQAPGPKIFQMYVLKDRGLTKELAERATAAGYKALCLTVDTQVPGNRERDHRTGMTIPPRFTLKSLANFARAPAWVINLLLRPGFDLANVSHRVDALSGGPIGVIEYVHTQYDRSLGWDEAAWLRKQWDGPFIIKGLQTVEDAKRARDIGATAIMISNHGGRQLDSSPAPLDCLPPIRDALGTDLELIVDGGIRRGSHIVKAMALGADACSVGRAYLYGLAAGGEAGVEKAISILRNEVERTLGLMGCADIKALDERYISRGR